MKIGVISDTHNHQGNLTIALARCQSEGITTLVHCGDFTDTAVAWAVEGWRVLAAFGNGDIASGEIRDVLKAGHPESDARLVYTGLIDGKRIAITHGHLAGKTHELVRSGLYSYVFYGHSHEHQDETIGTTRLINPGALGGKRPEPRHFCILDLDTGILEFISL